jgi:hypothetical protein
MAQSSILTHSEVHVGANSLSVHSKSDVSIVLLLIH